MIETDGKRVRGKRLMASLSAYLVRTSHRRLINANVRTRPVVAYPVRVSPIFGIQRVELRLQVAFLWVVHKERHQRGGWGLIKCGHLLTGGGVKDLADVHKQVSFYYSCG